MLHKKISILFLLSAFIFSKNHAGNLGEQVKLVFGSLGATNGLIAGASTYALAGCSKKARAIGALGVCGLALATNGLIDHTANSNHEHPLHALHASYIQANRKDLNCIAGAGFALGAPVGYASAVALHFTAKKVSRAATIVGNATAACLLLATKKVSAHACAFTNLMKTTILKKNRYII